MSVHRFVWMPKPEEEMRCCIAEYTIPGIPGCIGSCDATHLAMHIGTVTFMQLNAGRKYSHATRALNVTQNESLK